MERTELSEGESRMVGEIVRQLREAHPPRGGALWTKWSPLAFGLVLSVFGALLNAELHEAREDRKAANARIDTIEARSADNAVAIDRIDRDRAARIAQTEARIGAVEARGAPIEAMLKDIGRLETATQSMASRLAQGREERVADIAKIVDGMSVQKTEIALLRQELQQLRHALQPRGREPSGRAEREPERRPFGAAGVRIGLVR